MFSALLQAFLASFLVIAPAHSQASFGALGAGLLNSAYLQTGGLIFPNADGSGPQAESLAAAIYGVAIPPGFNQFSASENYFGSDLYSNGLSRSEARPSDLLVGTGIHINGNALHGGDQGGSYSSYISDFSHFGTGGFPQPSSDQRSSSSSHVEIDPIAARFGVVIANHESHASLFQPSLSGSAELFNGGTGAGAGEGTKDLFIASPVETSIRFDLPSQVTLPDVPQSALQFNSGSANLTPGSENGLGRVDDSSQSEYTTSSNTSLPSVSDFAKSQVDVISTAFKFSDQQISKTEELKRSFEQTTAAHIASGKFMPSPSEEINTDKHTEDPSDKFSSTPVKQKSDHSLRQSSPHSRPKEVKIFSKGDLVSKSTSPYVYRGGHRERQQAQPLVRSADSSESPENLPTAEYLYDAQPNRETDKIRTNSPSAQYSSYSFLTAPGYRAPK